MDVYLASSSPRRQELLRQLGIDHEVVVPDIPEVPLADERPAAFAERLAREKARAARVLLESRGAVPRPIIAADTVVVLDGEILGKPRDQAEGMAMLRRLAGRSHQVLTALCVIHEHVEHVALSASEVRFGSLSEEQIARYWHSGEPQDKAGGYAIQGLAAGFVAHVSGSYSGVVGLPLYELTQILNGLGFKL